jgi:glycosyltransferase involved in cell wall biosynthesis
VTQQVGSGHSNRRRVAVVHEWIASYAGSEQVFEAIAGTFPQADLYALSRVPSVQLDLAGRSVRTTILDRAHLRDRRSLTLPFMPVAWRALGRDNYDVVISSHHAFAHSNRLARPGGIHLSYVHSPARYVWSPEIDDRGASILLAPARSLLRVADRRASARVTDYAANSSAVAGRIRAFWHREARIIHPPVRVEFFGEHPHPDPSRSYVLGVGRWVPYKNLHMVIQAADIAGVPVKIAGRGPDASRIRAAAAAARVPVEIVESPDDDHLRDLYAQALCVVFPTVEDFGIVPVEAQAAGTPVVALSAGGALDTVVDGSTGALVSDCSPVELARGIVRCRTLAAVDCRENAQRFNLGRFQQEILAWADEIARTL